MARAVAPAELKDDGTMLAVGRTGIHHDEGAQDDDGPPDGGSHRAH
jgi:hypothetical protein